jgi:hypothetical protein
VGILKNAVALFRCHISLGTFSETDPNGHDCYYIGDEADRMQVLPMINGHSMLDEVAMWP